MIYLIGSLRNSQMPVIRQTLEDALQEEVFCSWYAAGPEADDKWMEYEKGRGLKYTEALYDYAAQHVYRFDKNHIERSDRVVLAYPAGRSGHLELGYAIGYGKPGFVLLDKEPERWDVMLAFADGVFMSVDELIEELRGDQ